jgi:aspartate-semialdehyde dehydrogenase
MFGHLEAVWIDTEKDLSIEEVKEAWSAFKLEAEYPSSAEHPVQYGEANTFPQPKYAFWGKPSGMVVYTGRLKKKNGKIGFILLVNNVVKGAAGGSIQNAEAFVSKYGLV